MRITEEQREMLGREFAMATWRDQKSVDYAVGRVSGFAEVDGRIVTFDKPHVETRFCFGEHGYDYAEVNEHCSRMSESEDFFIRENLKDFDRIQRLIDGAREGAWTPWMSPDRHGSRLGEVVFSRGAFDSWGRPMEDEHERVSAEGLDAYEALVADERGKFEKRLRTYLKRYGLSKCHFWTYWADR